ncbi:MAG: flavin monoamine oxidase family protein [Marmoricola sp.]
MRSRGMELDRRSVLAGSLGAMAALAVGTEIATAEAAVAAGSLQGALPASVDVVVVGGGISGLVTARALAQKGKRVLVLEARNRVGGRTLNHRLSTGQVIESGGAFIGPTQDHIAALAAELKVPTFPEYNTGNSTYVSSGPLSGLLGHRQTYSGTVPQDPTILLDAAWLQNQFDTWAAEIDVNAPWAHPRAKEWDAMTVRDYITRNAVNAAGIDNLIECWTQPGFGADTGELSLLYVLHYIACSGDEKNKGTFERNSNTADGAQERRFVGGSQLISLRLAQQLGSRVALNAAVTKIVQTSTHVEVTSKRGTVRAAHIVVACPPPLVRKIQWYPHLPARRAALMNALTMGHLMKCDAVYSTPFWRKAGLNGFGISDHGATRAVFDNTPPQPGSPGVLLAFVGGGTWRQYGTMTLANRRAAVLQGFAEMFGPEALHPIDYVEHDWDHEPWTTGGPVAIYKPGVMSTYGSSIRTPFGRVHWAGTETSTYWTGYMDGAVRAGQRAAAEILRLR